MTTGYFHTIDGKPAYYDQGWIHESAFKSWDILATAKWQDGHYEFDTPDFYQTEPEYLEREPDTKVQFDLRIMKLEQATAISNYKSAGKIVPNFGIMSIKIG